MVGSASMAIASSGEQITARCSFFGIWVPAGRLGMGSEVLEGNIVVKGVAVWDGENVLVGGAVTGWRVLLGAVIVGVKPPPAGLQAVTLIANMTPNMEKASW
jgi:hypothetical protein